MNLRFAKFLSILVLVATTTTVVSTKAIANDTNTQKTTVETLPEIFERAFYNQSGNIYQNTTPPRQLEFIFGPYRGGTPAYPEIELLRDAKLINTIYNDALVQQNSSDPVLRTLDLPNPYETSLRVMPTTSVNRPVVGGELFYERPPLGVEKAPAGVRARY